jgi:hypothetical protein
MNKTIELKDKQYTGDGKLELFAECNVYSDDVLIQQLSRTFFVFDAALSDQEIVDYLWNNEYKIYQ